MKAGKLQDKVCVITGGSSGIGLATARLFLNEGARVVIAARGARGLDAAKRSLGGSVTTVQADVSLPDELKTLMDGVGRSHGQIDVLFANAGISECPDILKTDEAFFDEIMSVNVKGVFFAFTHALPWMPAHAAAIFTSSIIQQRGRPGDVLYAATKAATRSLARTLAVDDRVLARHIRVNVVSPGAIRTPLTVAATSNQEISEWVEGQVPLGRWGEAEEVARAVLFLSCSEASYMTGGEIAVDGGLGQI